MNSQTVTPIVEAAARLYGVSFGNGNEGVSHMHPDYYVMTIAPFVLVRAAMLNNIRLGLWPWALDCMDVSGEPDTCISAVLSEGPNGETEFGVAWLICEVFPVDEKTNDAPLFDTLKQAFDPATLRRALEAAA